MLITSDFATFNRDDESASAEEEYANARGEKARRSATTERSLGGKGLVVGMATLYCWPSLLASDASHLSSHAVFLVAACHHTHMHRFSTPRLIADLHIRPRHCPAAVCSAASLDAPFCAPTLLPRDAAAASAAPPHLALTRPLAASLICLPSVLSLLWTTSSLSCACSHLLPRCILSPCALLLEKPVIALRRSPTVKDTHPKFRVVELTPLRRVNVHTTPASAYPQA